MTPPDRTAGLLVAAPHRPSALRHGSSTSQLVDAARLAAPAAMAAAFAFVYAGCALLLSHPAAASGTEGYGYVGSTSLHGLLRWDGAWYARIAQDGYQATAGRYQPFAFFPLFPALASGLHWALPFLSIPAAGIAVNVMAVVAAAVLVDRSLPAWRLSHRLLLIAALLAMPSAFFDVAFYSEGLFLFASALVVWSVAKPSRLTWAPLGVVLGSLDRPLGFLLVILVLAALRRREQTARQRLTIAAASLLGAIAVPVLYWRLAGNPIAFVTAQGGWTSLHTLGLGDSLRWLLVQLNPWSATNPVVSFGYWEALVLAVPVLLYVRRHRPDVALYGAFAAAGGFLLGGVGTQSRYLAALVPLWIAALIALHRGSQRRWIAVAMVVSVTGLACNLWLISRFAAGVWAG